jgi:hypothetical protein
MDSTEITRVRVPSQEILVWPPARISRHEDLPAGEFIVYTAILPIVSQTPGDEEAVVRCHSHVPTVEECVDVRPEK